jgi:hypothetical protein
VALARWHEPARPVLLGSITAPCAKEEVGNDQQPLSLHGSAIVGMIVDHRVHQMSMKLGDGT